MRNTYAIEEMIWEVTLVFFSIKSTWFHIFRKQNRWFLKITCVFQFPSFQAHCIWYFIFLENKIDDFWKLHVYFNFPLFKLLFLLHKNYIYYILLFKRVTCNGNTKWWNHLFWLFPCSGAPSAPPMGGGWGR